MKNLIRMLYILLAMMFTNVLTNSQNTLEDTSSISANKWHPKVFYVFSDSLNLTFRLPYEPDQSGFYNLFFISKEFDEPLLLYTIEDEQRYLTPFSSGSSYDAVLLYNNGKYVRYNNIIFKNGAEVDMSNQNIHPCDSFSKRWKNLRTFDDGNSNQVSDTNSTGASEFIIKGYVFIGRIEPKDWEHWKDWEATVKLIESVEEWIVKDSWTTRNKYFEIAVKEDIEQTLFFSGLAHLNSEKTVEVSCGLIVVLPPFGKAQKDTRVFPIQNE